MKLMIAILIFALAILAWARPFTVACPIDGQGMMFDHQVGFGQSAVCWYSHQGYNPRTARTEKHEAYIPCGD